jgi:hypothetical protein
MTKEILDLFRWIFLVLASMAIFSVGIWVFLPGAVDLVDRKIESLYVGYYQSQLDQANGLIDDENYQAAFSELSEFLDFMDPIGPQDKVSGIKAQAYSQIITASIKLSRTESETLALFYKWINFDSKNLESKLRKASFLMASGRDIDAHNLFDQLVFKFPNSELVVKAYSSALLAANKRKLAVEAVVPYLKNRATKPKGRWMVSTITDGGDWRLLPTYPQFVSGDGGYRFSLAIEAPINMKTVQYRLPDSYLGWCVGGLELNVKGKGPGFQVPLGVDNEGLKLSAMQWKGGVIEVLQGGAQLSWSPSEPDSVGGVKYTLWGSLYDCAPEWVVDTFVDSELKQILKLLESDSGSNSHIISRLRGLVVSSMSAGS